MKKVLTSKKQYAILITVNKTSRKEYYRWKN
nr:MAG TPA: hypothetical protein [Caudoviricetes sp.]